MTSSNTPNVAFIGLGSMGLGMAKNLLKAGHRVVGVDPSATARDAFVAAGGTVETTPAAAAASADVVVVAVVNAPQVEMVLYGDNGAVAGLRKPLPPQVGVAEQRLLRGLHVASRNGCWWCHGLL